MRESDPTPVNSAPGPRAGPERGTQVTLMRGVDRFEEIIYSRVDIMKSGQNNLARHVWTNISITFDLIHDPRNEDTDFIIPFFFTSERSENERKIRPEIRFTTYVAFLNFHIAPYDGDPYYIEKLEKLHE